MFGAMITDPSIPHSANARTEIGKNGSCGNIGNCAKTFNSHTFASVTSGLQGRDNGTYGLGNVHAYSPAVLKCCPVETIHHCLLSIKKNTIELERCVTQQLLFNHN